jgi:glycosyltransferase 2 family protein
MTKFREVWKAWGGWRFPLSLILAALLLFLAFRQANLQEMLVTARQGHLDLLALALVVSSLLWALRSLRWQILLNAEKAIPRLTIFWGMAAGYLGNALLPARAGELIRSVLLGQKAQISKSYVLATALTERLFDALALVLIGFATVGQFGLTARWLVTALNVMLVVGLSGAAFLLVAPRLEKPLLAVLSGLPLPRRLNTLAADFAHRFLLGARAFQHPGRALGFAALTAVIWLSEGLLAGLTARAFGLTLALPGALLLIAALGLSSSVPSTPGYVGVYQFIAVAVLTPLGFSRNEALTYILAVQAITYILCLLWGTLGLWQLDALPFRGKPL